jgi:Tfp pilus assembly protein PilX
MTRNDWTMRRVVERARNSRETSPDAGVAMVVVLGIMLVGAVITTTLVMVTLFNTRNTLENRVEMRALQSADAGLDLILSEFEGKKYNELYQVCAQTFVINNDTVSVETTYTVDRGGVPMTVSCPLSTDVTTSVTVQSTATTSVVPLSGDAVTRTVAAVFAPTPPETLLDKAIFSEATTTITNNTKLTPSGAVDALGNPIYDAHVYSNGSVNCKTQVDSAGSIYAAQGDVTLENTCEVYNSVWASGKVALSSQTHVQGNVYAASSASDAVRLSNSTSLVDGSVLTTGGIYINGGQVGKGGGITGSAFARTGSITLDNGGEIGGSGYAKGDIKFQNKAGIFQDAISQTGDMTTLNNQNWVGGNAFAGGTISHKLDVGGTAHPSTSVNFPAVPNPAETFPASVGYPNAIQPPPREQMPQLTMSAADILKWEAAGWTTEVYTGDCTSNGPANIVNNPPTGATGPRLIIFTGCSGNAVYFNNHTLTLKTDVAMVSETGFQSQNLHFVQSDDLSEVRKYFWIVPADAPGVNWVSVGSGQTTPQCTGSAPNISIDKVKTWSINWMIYTPCSFNWQNGQDSNSEPFIGQMYAGTVSLPNATDIQMQTIPVPSLSSSAPNLTDVAEINMSSRFDVRN